MHLSSGSLVIGKRVVLALAAAVLLVASAGAYTVFGQSNSNDVDLIYACVNSRDGSIYNVSDSPQSCRFGHEQIVWEGGVPDAFTTAPRSESASFELTPGQSETVEASCEAGEVAVGGGVDLETDLNLARNRGLSVHTSTLNGTADGWRGTVADTRATGALGATGTLIVTVICVEGEPPIPEI